MERNGTKRQGGVFTRGNEIYTAALAVLSQRPGDNEVWDSCAVDWLNLLLAECMPYENVMRRFDGAPQLHEAPRVEDLEEELPVHGMFFAAMADGMAAILWDEARNQYKAQDYRTRCAMELQGCLAYRPESVVNVYGGSNENF